jgi:hypothetical protein
LRAEEYFVHVDFAIEAMISLLYPFAKFGVAEEPSAWLGFGFCCIRNWPAVENLSNEVPGSNDVYDYVIYGIK